jgi:hypothetical protein
MLNLYYPEIENIYRFRMSTQILHWTNLLLIMSEMMTRVHLANIYRCNRFYIGPLNHCFLSEIMTRVYIDVTKIHLQLTNVSMLWRSTAVTKGQSKGIQGSCCIFTNVNSNWQEHISKKKLYDLHFTNNRTGFKDFKLAITPTYPTLHRE